MDTDLQKLHGRLEGLSKGVWNVTMRMREAKTDSYKYFKYRNGLMSISDKMETLLYKYEKDHR